MSVCLDEIIASAGYDVNDSDDARAILSILNDEDIEELREKCGETMDKEDEERGEDDYE